MFESRLIKLEQHLEDPFTALVGKVSKEDQPPSSSIHHKTIPPKREIPQEEIDHEQLLSPPKNKWISNETQVRIVKIQW